ncbi:PAAR domain-containing protein [Wolbachia endosymbiont (group B) of Melanostoma mellinum]|uniref:PAAR domain-containing protein n=1 Tax=Wolbachia endosymbiont (group B) of Melanostoma mellinum TaxID=2954030 RepID=UPI0022305F9B|nr:PAAR domain-containing protein [Wolbachia endosymbiont (group B) of Melanostoma mellinum]
MNKSVVRLGDYCIETTPHFCISGSNNVFVNGKPVCRKGDNFTEGRVLTEGSKTVFANGYGVGRVGDIVSCSNTMKRGSNNVFSE